MISKYNPELKLIKHNAGNVEVPDDLTYPFKLVAEFRPPKVMQDAFILRHGGSEEIVMRAMTKKALDAFIKANDLRRHVRLRRLTITGPDGVIEELSK